MRRIYYLLKSVCLVKYHEWRGDYVSAFWRAAWNLHLKNQDYNVNAMTRNFIRIAKYQKAKTTIKCAKRIFQSLRNNQLRCDSNLVLEKSLLEAIRILPKGRAILVTHQLFEDNDIFKDSSLFHEIKRLIKQKNESDRHKVAFSQPNRITGTRQRATGKISLHRRQVGVFTARSHRANEITSSNQGVIHNPRIISKTSRIQPL